jgi:hypothetical protein
MEPVGCISSLPCMPMVMMEIRETADAVEDDMICLISAPTCTNTHSVCCTHMHIHIHMPIAFYTEWEDS